VSDATNQSEFHFVFAFSEHELRAFRKSKATLFARGDTNHTAIGLLGAAPIAIGLLVLGAFKVGFIAPATLRAVLVTAFGAFTAGVAGHYFLVKRHLRKLDASGERSWRGTWNFSFDDGGVHYKNERVDVHLTWRAIDAVHDLRTFVLVTHGRGALPIPSRVFTDDAARLAFVAAVAARIKQQQRVLKGRAEAELQVNKKIERI
jgi:hypothetical protein